MDLKPMDSAGARMPIAVPPSFSLTAFRAWLGHDSGRHLPDVLWGSWWPGQIGEGLAW
jgi:hypothetical protein